MGNSSNTDYKNKLQLNPYITKNTEYLLFGREWTEGAEIFDISDFRRFPTAIKINNDWLAVFIPIVDLDGYYGEGLQSEPFIRIGNLDLRRAFMPIYSNINGSLNVYKLTYGMISSKTYYADNGIFYNKYNSNGYISKYDRDNPDKQLINGYKKDTSILKIKDDNIEYEVLQLTDTFLVGLVPLKYSGKNLTSLKIWNGRENAMLGLQINGKSLVLTNIYHDFDGTNSIAYPYIHTIENEGKAGTIVLANYENSYVLNCMFYEIDANIYDTIEQLFRYEQSFPLISDRINVEYTTYNTLYYQFVSNGNEQTNTPTLYTTLSKKPYWYEWVNPSNTDTYGSYNVKGILYSIFEPYYISQFTEGSDGSNLSYISLNYLDNIYSPRLAWYILKNFNTRYKEPMFYNRDMIYELLNPNSDFNTKISKILSGTENKLINLMFDKDFSSGEFTGDFIDITPISSSLMSNLRSQITDELQLIEQKYYKLEEQEKLELINMVSVYNTKYYNKLKNLDLSRLIEIKNLFSKYEEYYQNIMAKTIDMLSAKNYKFALMLLDNDLKINLFKLNVIKDAFQETIDRYDNYDIIQKADLRGKLDLLTLRLLGISSMIGTPMLDKPLTQSQRIGSSILTALSVGTQAYGATGNIGAAIAIMGIALIGGLLAT